MIRLGLRTLSEHCSAAAILGVITMFMFMNLGRSALIPEEIWVVLTATRNGMYDMIFGSNYHARITPVGHLFVLKGIHALFGDNDYLYRLPILLFHLAGCVLGYAFTFRVTKSKIASLIFLLLWVCNFMLIGYGYELKQYTADSFFTLAISYAYYELHIRNALTNASHVTMLTALSLVAILFSHTAIFIFATVCLTWCFRSRNKRALPYMASYAALGTGAFFLLYVFVIQEPASRFAARHYDQYAVHFIDADNFVHLTRLLYDGISDYVIFFIAQNIIGNELGMGSTVYIILWIFSLVVMFRRKNHSLLLLVTVPFLIAFTLAAMELYPFGGHRTNRYLSPLTAVTIAYGVGIACERMLRSKGKRRATVNVLSVTSVTLLFLLYGEIATAHLAHNHMDDYLEVVADARSQHDVIAYCPNTELQLRYYQPALLDEAVTFSSHERLPEEVNALIGKGGNRRYWIICTRSQPLGQPEPSNCTVSERYQRHDDKIARIELIECDASNEVVSSP